MFTNAYPPRLCGVASTVKLLVDELYTMGHMPFVVAPGPAPQGEQGVLRAPPIVGAVGNAKVPLAFPGLQQILPRLARFRPAIVHTHNPYALGVTGLHVARALKVPCVYTYHTAYGDYVQRWFDDPGNQQAGSKAACRLVAFYANLTTCVIAPSQDTLQALQDDGVRRPAVCIHNGVDVKTFAGGDGLRFRQAWNIPADAFVVGHVGRLSPEKNLAVLTRVALALCRTEPNTIFLLVGSGPAEDLMPQAFDRHGLGTSLRATGALRGAALAAAYAAMDSFVSASKTETFGCVGIEAMAAGVPVVTFVAPGFRDYVQSDYNGYLVPTNDEATLVQAVRQTRRRADVLRAGARQTARSFDKSIFATRTVELYRSLL